MSPRAATVPRGGDVTARSVSNMKAGDAAARNLWQETNLNGSVLRGAVGRHYVAQPPACTYCQLTKALTSEEAHSTPHANIYVTVTLCLPVYPESSPCCGNVRAEYKSVASATKLLTPHFLSFPVLKPLLLQNVSYTIYVSPVSHHLCFSPMINHRNTTHATLEFS